MELKSFVVTIEEFLKFEEKKTEGEITETLFFKNINQYSIPLYQREYKWEVEQVGELIHDIAEHDKFLGIIILNRREKSYDVIDGQQRITTIILLLVGLFNRMCSAESNDINLEQRPILKYIKKGDNFILSNESLGSWLCIQDNKIVLSIEEENDIYHQKETFVKCQTKIKNMLNSLNAGRKFLDKLLNSKVLVLICDVLGTYSSEQIFLDMNDKLLRLDAEAIFKGHCFSICHADYHELLKNKWIHLKANYFKLEGWGCRDFGTFIYHYILCLNDYEKINSELKIGGRHFLENKTNDDIINFLDSMVNYSDNLCCFKENLGKDVYRFEDICPDFSKYKNVDITVLKDMFKYILEHKDQYYKFPLLMLINFLKNTPTFYSDMTFDIFKSIISNYYIYSFAFINRCGKKDKSHINRTIFSLLENGNEDIKVILNEIKKLRKENIRLYNLSEKFNKEQFCALYTIMDNFDINTNFISKVYNDRNGYNDEHFILHNNKNYNIVWINSDDEKQKINIILKDYIDKDYLNKWRDCFANHLIIPKKLNEDILESFDIVTKINRIENYYEIYNKGVVPRHIGIFLEYIKSFDAYKSLVELKKLDIKNADTKEVICNTYKTFIEKYFEDSMIEQQKESIQKQLLKMFEN